MLVCYIMRRNWSHARDLRPALPITNRLHRCLCLHGRRPSPRRDSHPHLADFKSEASSVGLRGVKRGRRRTCSPGRFPGPISLAMSPGSLVRFTFQDGLHARNCTLTTRFEASHAIYYITRRDKKVERRPGLAPGKNRFASCRLDGFGMRRIKCGTPGRICTGIDPV